MKSNSKIIKMLENRIEQHKAALHEALDELDKDCYGPETRDYYWNTAVKERAKLFECLNIIEELCKEG